ncbi:PfkB family carbohydrate kinase [Verrucosispora sp. FIM060022]|uniref:carbohydrate kinase family protein n=1 Tax=Verrucosispora sp. FIM060022 TaxID=1479020 RepID=UPI000F873D6B|nr:PfkB family carbohydrate kinase [Verrucosispora sp. FIM060022]RUL90872.1 carbohydrate kinase family protein [Verrucosispora sp. FIM060022]
MYDLLVLGGLGVDIRVRVPDLPLPVVDSVTVEPIDLRIGNTGAGVVLAAHALGLRVAVVDTLGTDSAGDVVRAALSRTGVHAVLASTPAGTRRSVNLVDPAGRRMSLYDPRPSDGTAPIPVAQVATLVEQATHVHLSIMNWVRDLLPALGDMLGEGVGSSTDLHDWDGQNPYHRPFAEIAELVLVSGVTLGDRSTAVGAALAPRPVLVTWGADGADLHLGGVVTRIPAATPPGPVVDTNGAGDAFAAGIITARSRGATWAEAAGYAARVAAAACTHDGMEYPPGLLPHH